MADKLQAALAKLPTTPGVYLFKAGSAEIIYVGKAANLRNRVRQYFQKSRARDPKTEALVASIADLSWIELESEADALFLEAELIRRYKPRFNILLRDDKSQLWVRIDSRSDYPTVTTLRRPLDDGAEYFGPYINGYALKKALRYLRRAFPFATARSVGSKRANLHYHLGLDPGLEDGHTSLEQYRANLKKLKLYLKGEKTYLLKYIEREMKKASKQQNFELAAKLRNQLQALNQLNRQVLFGDKENIDLTLDDALVTLSKILNLKAPPRRIEAFDVSHMQGTDRVASMVVFKNGAPDKASYRKFKLRPTKNNDYAGIYEAVFRRHSPDNVKKWGLSDLLLIDGGKGQLEAAQKAQEARQQGIASIGLAKRFETIIIRKDDEALSLNEENLRQACAILNARLTDSANHWEIVLPPDLPVAKLLLRIRDESHRFAVSYHSSLKRTRQSASLLDEIPGIGPATKTKLIKIYGSTRGVTKATEQELISVLGEKKGSLVYQFLNVQDKHLSTGNTTKV